MNDCLISQLNYPPGTIININKTDFIILEYDIEYPYLMKVISKDILWVDVAFGVDANWKKSVLRKELNYGLMFNKIKSVFGSDKLHFFKRNLASLDGFNDSYCYDIVSLLTLEEYGKYKNILHWYPPDSAWWLLTPRSTIYNQNNISVTFIQKNELVDFQIVGFKAGVRPVVVTDISIIENSKVSNNI